MNLALQSIHTLTRQFEAAGIPYASGGSGLLYSLGLARQVRDWDLTTDAAYGEVAVILDELGLVWHRAAAGDYPFASSYRITIKEAADASGETMPIDLIGSFAIHSESGLCRLPSLAAFEWEGLRMASPEVWAAAYSLMGRQDKAEALWSYLRQHGANKRAVSRMAAEPLPPGIRSRLMEIPAAEGTE
ncbi:hypothetical protein [Paenibacillus rigui]|uniref:Uncharacterized protein n=1 Tax=Paenibacillus rigui TaxID=554312 RepID=A0A229UIC4_9BACL|nr:hypothetical protein [Paenibacillus rigui]OXM83188.1 hypothetical protein CF651_27020 [Paenibacillus rigui]